MMPDQDDVIERQRYKVLAPIRTRRKVDPSTGNLLGSSSIAQAGDILLLSEEEATAIAGMVEMVAETESPAEKASTKTTKSAKPLTPNAAT